MVMSLWAATVRRQSDICVAEECGWSYMEKIIFLIAAVLIYINLPKIFSYFYQEDLTADNDAFTPWGRFLRRHFSEPLPPFAKYGIIVMIIAAVLIMACMYFFA